MFFKVVSETSETRQSLDEYDVDYFLKLHEAISLKDYLEELRFKDIEIKRNNEKNQPKV